MSLENGQEESAPESSPAVLHQKGRCPGGLTKQPPNIVAFKFGGSSLLGADPMRPASFAPPPGNLPSPWSSPP
jgi:hypothetical protein